MSDRGLETVQLAHGGGGRAMRGLIEGVFLDAFANPTLDVRHDAAVLTAGGERLAFTTDSYVVSPTFFPGGDIGKLAVYGTVNDLAVAGARPRWLSAGFILEEGLPLDELRRVVASMRDAAALAGVQIVTGDTKVVDRGNGDGIFINTAGVGVVREGADVRPSRVEPGAAIIVSGDLGRHGVTVLSERNGLGLSGDLASDCAPLAELVDGLYAAGVDPLCLRDLTRGGLAAALNEIALDAGLDMEVDETAVPVSDPVRGACELLGLDPLYVANEGRLVAFVPPDQVEPALAAMRARPEAGAAAAIGRVTGRGRGWVTLRGAIGGTRPLDLLSGEQLPRIC